VSTNAILFTDCANNKRVFNAFRIEFAVDLHVC
jgi:hypothetical protein